MGVKGLWKLLEPVGRPVTLESLDGKVLGVDASILLNQAVKGMRDKSGQPLPNAHLIVLFNKLCKLLFYRIKPVFVFDGGVPVLKKRTMAARRERKFKARHGSNKAAEKLVKNYLKGKALESVTGKRSGTQLFRNISTKEPDLFELPSISNTQEKAESASGSEEDNDDDLSLLEQFYTQQDFQHKYQDPSSINVESEDFCSLPEEIQHELIKDMMEERKWMMKPTLPQDAFSFSDFQLHSVLQRGKLHQRMDELRKTMNSRNTGEIAGFSSQGQTGANSTVQSRKILSEDSGHYILVKRNIGDNEQVSSSGDNSTEGGFFHDNQNTTYQIEPKQLQAPRSIDIDLNYEASSDSDDNSPLMDVPEVAPSSPWYTSKETILDIEKRTVNADQTYNTKAMTLKDVPNKCKELPDMREEFKETAVTVDTEKDKVVEQSGRILDTGDDENSKESKSDEVMYKTKGNSLEIVNNMSMENKQKANIHGNCLVEKINQQCNNKRDTGMEVEGSRNEMQPSNFQEDTNLNNETDCNEDEIQKRKAQIELLLQTRVNMDIGRTEPVFHNREATQTGEDASVGLVLHVKSSKADGKQEKENAVMNKEQGMEIGGDKSGRKDDNVVCASNMREEEPVLVDEEEDQAGDVTSLKCPFAGSSKEDLEEMQVDLELEQSSLQTEQARQERSAATVSSEMFAESQELLRLFGVPYLVSPMEAEAQCAFLDLTNQTQGTITDDSDIFLFGGQRVYKHLFNQNKHPEYFASEAIAGRLALDRSKLIKLALITGSDYTEGIQGLGAVGAMEVLHEFNHDGFEALQKFKKWHDETKNNKQKTQETNVKKKLRAINLPTGFPSQEVFDSYINPVVDESRESFHWGKPDLHSLRLFAKEKLGWTSDKTDEILLPVLKQLNEKEIQKRIDNFFPIKFHETKKKSSKRVRRVVNRFLHPLSDSTGDEEKNNQRNSNSQPANRNRKSHVGGRARQKRHSGDIQSNNVGQNRTFDQDLFDQSDGELERLVNSGTLNEKNAGVFDLSGVDRKEGQTDITEMGRRKDTKIPKENEEIQNKDAEDRKRKRHEITQVTRKPVNSNTNQDRHGVQTYRSKSLKTANDFILNTKECGLSGQRSTSEDSSTPSDTDSEEERKIRIPSDNFRAVGGRSAGTKRPTGKRLNKSK